MISYAVFSILSGLNVLSLSNGGDGDDVREEEEEKEVSFAPPFLSAVLRFARPSTPNRPRERLAEVHTGS